MRLRQIHNSKGLNAKTILKFATLKSSLMRTHNCGELRIDNVGNKVVLCGWVQRVRDKGGMVWVDLRDRYGITQLIAQEGEQENALLGQIRELGREFVLSLIHI